MSTQKEDLECQELAYGLEALVSVIEDEDALISALKEAGKRFSTFTRGLEVHTD